MINQTALLGTLAFYDSFSGLVPVRLVDVHRDGGFTVAATAARGPYAKGDCIRTTQRHVIPRAAVRGVRSMAGARILPYAWQLIDGPRTSREAGAMALGRLS